MSSETESHRDPAATAGPHIVVGVDGSPSSMRALAWAASEAELRGTALVVVHVDFARQEALEALAPEMLLTEQSVLDRAVAQARDTAPSVAVTGVICDPPAGKALIAASERADLLVVGSRGLSGIKGVWLGSVSSECAHRAHCPVVIVRPSSHERSPANEAGVIHGSAETARAVDAP